LILGLLEVGAAVALESVGFVQSRQHAVPPESQQVRKHVFTAQA